nr:putative harbinger transposase-derived protein [Tanacetum cinerariifolium]
MNSYRFMGLDDVEEGEEEISSRKKSFIKRAIAYIEIRRQASRLTRNSITKDRAGAHERLVAAFFSITQWHEFLRKPMVTDTEKLYRHHEEKHGFLGMLGSLDCMD